MLQTVFGTKVKQCRIERGLSQDELAAASGIERPQISKIEQGKSNATLETIERIADALGIKSHELLMSRNELHPFVKWAGGKTQLLEKLRAFMPSHFNNYYEPFIGGGSFFLNIAPKRAVINDFNSELIIAYQCIKDDADYVELKKLLRIHEENHSEEYFYKIREMDRQEDFLNLPNYVRAARMIYLNKSCFNGLYRVNSKGYFNVPSAKKVKVNTFDEEHLDALHEYLKNNDITILNTDYKEAVKTAKKGDFVYFDPPYDPFENKDSFTSYSKDDFGKDDQVRLAETFEALDKKGVYVMLSNHNTAFIRNLYQKYNINVVEARRVINSNANGRGEVEEVIITNFKNDEE